jgi:subtilase family serine protease
MIRFHHTRLAAGVLLGVGALLAPLAATSGPALASTPNPNAPTQVPSGISAPDLPGATVFGSTPAGTAVTVSFVLKEQNESSLESAVEAGIPGNRYLSVGQFASLYGQPAANISALTSYLAGYGISTDVYADHVDVVATGTAGEFDQALTVQEKTYNVPQQAGTGSAFGPIRAQRVFSNSQPPLLPYRLASFVTAILGLSNYAPYASQTAHVDTSLLTPQPTSTSSCLALTGLPDACNLPQNFAANYGLDGLYSRGADGSGQTLAIVTLATVDPGPAGYTYAPQYYWAKVADINRTGSLTVQNIDGGSGAPSAAAGSGETDLDIEQSGGLARGANVVVYQAPNTDYGLADGFFTAASQNVASTVSASWLESETYLEAGILNNTEAAGYNAAYDEAFLEMAAQGQSGFIASGDWGAYTATADIGTTNLSIGSNADSPFITAAGGTTLPWTGTLTGPDGSATVTVPAQRIWGWDYLWQPTATVTGEPLAEAAESQVIGSGGGFSTLEPRPSYQQFLSGRFDAVPYLTPTDYVTVAPGLNEPVAWNFNPTPRVISGSGSGRMDPDVSTDADPYTGYLLYAPSNSPALQGGWGGTSFVAPQLNGSTAVIDSYLGHRVGFWNPAIYAAAVSFSSPLTPLNQVGTGNDNIYYTGNPGEPYNLGAGLGYPNLTALASYFH